MTLLCDYNMGDYFQYWIDVGNAAQDKDKLPKELSAILDDLEARLNKA